MSASVTEAPRTVSPGSTSGVGRSVFGRLRNRVRWGIKVEGIAWLLVAVAGFVLVSYTVDRVLRLEIGYRAGLLVGFAVLLGYLVHRHILRPLRFELGDDELALAVERGDPAAREGLISAVQFERSLDTRESTPRAESEFMMRRVIDDVGQRVGSLAVDRGARRWPRRAFRRFGRRAGAGSGRVDRARWRQPRAVGQAQSGAVRHAVAAGHAARLRGRADARRGRQ